MDERQSHLFYSLLTRIRFQVGYLNYYRSAIVVADEVHAIMTGLNFTHLVQILPSNILRRYGPAKIYAISFELAGNDALYLRID